MSDSNNNEKNYMYKNKILKKKLKKLTTILQPKVFHCKQNFSLMFWAERLQFRRLLFEFRKIKYYHHQILPH